MSVTKKTKVGTIDLTPTWVEMCSLIELALVDGNAVGRATARAELQKMARLADAFVEQVRKSPDVQHVPTILPQRPTIGNGPGFGGRRDDDEVYGDQGEG